MKWIFACLVLLSGTVLADGIMERIQARGRCRKILVHKNEVVVRFTCEEDADIFARDLAELLKD
jgi:hypothetical protein